MADSKSDLLMQITGPKGPLKAECNTDIDSTKDDYLKGFTQGCYFECSDFSFGFDLVEDAPTDKAKALIPNRGTGSYALPGQEEKKKKEKVGAFARWKSASEDEMKKMRPYPIRMKEFEITRVYDRASPALFQACCDSTPFTSALLVKRKDIGGDRVAGFIRFEFSDVLITSINWKEGTVLKESVKFLFRSVVYRFKFASYVPGQKTLQLAETGGKTWTYDTKLAPTGG